MKPAHVCCHLTTGFACAILLVWAASAIAGATVPIKDSGAKYDSFSTGMRGEDLGRLGAFRAALETNGFIVNEGSSVIADPLTAVDEKLIDSASGNNAGQFYKMLQVPLSSSSGENQDTFFTLGSSEAIIYVGPTPPRCDYFSFTPFLWVRQMNSLIPKGDWIFAAAGDPLNNALIKTEGNGNPFRKQTIVIFTADHGVYERIAGLAVAAGYPESMINSYVLPSELLHLGTDPAEADSLAILVRTANLTSAAQNTNYLADDYYAHVLRVTPHPEPAPDLFPTPQPRDRKSKSERDLYPDLEAGLARLKAAILARTPNLTHESFDSIRWFAESREVLQENDPSSSLYHKFVAGEASDTPYLRSAMNGEPANFTLGSGDMVIVYGVNHAATGLATYSSFGVYGDWVTADFCRDNPLEYEYGCNDRIWNGVVGMTNHDFAGSAEQYIPGDPMAPYLYAVKVLRRPSSDKHDKYVVVVPGADPETQCQSPSHCIDLANPMMIGYRAYLNPATASGPDYDDIIHDRALRFKLR